MADLFPVDGHRRRTRRVGRLSLKGESRERSRYVPPIHPGEVLMEEYLEPLGVTQHRLAIAIGVPPRRINEIVHGKRRFARTLHYAWRATSVRLSDSG